MLKPDTSSKRGFMPPPDVPGEVTFRAGLVTYPGSISLGAGAGPGGEWPARFEWRTTAFELDAKVFEVSGELTASQGQTGGVPLQVAGDTGAKEKNLLVDIVEVKVGEAGRTLSVPLQPQAENALDTDGGRRGRGGR